MRSFPYLLCTLAMAATSLSLPAADLTPFYPDDPLFFHNPETPLLPGQWNLVNQAPGVIVYPCFTSLTGRVRAETTITNIGLDMAISNAWRQGYTGAGLVVGVLDDGVELSHPDLDVRADLSMGFNSNSLAQGQTGAPMRPEDDPHGTCVAGCISAIGGNGIGICGPAPRAQIASLRLNYTGMDDFFVHAPGYYWQAGLGWSSGMTPLELACLTNLLEAPAIAIKNSSTRTLPFDYTPDFGEHHSALARMAANGVILTLAACNCRESRLQDSAVFAELCNPYGIPIAALGSDGRYALYSSFGAPVMACALSESSYWNPQDDPAKTNFANGLGVYATDVTGSNGINFHSDSTVFLPDLEDTAYTAQFDGTSAAAPLMAGILALARQACPIMDARMAKHLLIRSSRQVDPEDNSPSSTWQANGALKSGWLTNAAGFCFNPNYGFGLPDASALVSNSINAAYVTRETFCSTGLKTVADTNKIIEAGNSTGCTESISITVPAALKQSLESIEVYIRVSGADRGEWQIILNSPAGMSSRLYTPSAFAGNSNFYFADPCITGGLDRILLTQAFWGENPDGVWSLNISNPTGTNPAVWHAFGLILHMGEIAFETAGATIITQSLEIRGLTLDNPASRMVIDENCEIRTTGNAIINAGSLEVDGTLAKGDFLSISRLDTTLAEPIENLSFQRGARMEITGGLLAGTGLLNLPPGADGKGGVCNIAGTVRAGSTNNAGALTILGNYIQGPDATLEIFASSSNAFGRLVVSGNASLGGKLLVHTPAGLDIGPGYRLPAAINAGSITGGFSSIETHIPAAQSNLYWTVVTNAGALDLVARPLYTNTIALLTDAVTELMATQRVMGLSLALVDDQETVWATGFGFADKEQNLPAKSNTVYRIASVSKLFTAMLAMQTIEEGLAQLDAPLTNILSDFSLLPRFTNNAPITLRSLMNHQSGLPGDTYNGSDTTEHFTPYAAYNAWLFDYLCRGYPTMPPDAIAVYCNNGFVLLAEIVETLAGIPFPLRAENSLFKPLGMTSASYLKDKPAISNLLARSYADYKVQPEEFVNCLGTGGIYASMPDLAQAIKMLLAGGETPAGRILEAASIEAMAQPQGANLPLNLTDACCGLGFDSVKEPGFEYAGRVCWKDGASLYFSAYFAVALDQKIGVAIACNSPANLDSLFRLALQNAILEKTGIAAPTNQYAPPASPIISLPQSDIDALAGLYAGNALLHLATAQPGAITVSLMANTEHPMVLSNLVPRANGMFSEAGSQTIQLAFTNIAGKSILVLHEAKNTYESKSILGEYCPVVPAPAAWSNRFNRVHLACDVVPNDFFWRSPKNLTLCLGSFASRPILNALGANHVIEPQNDSLAFIRELPSRADSAIMALQAGNAELLRFGGYHWTDQASIPELPINTPTNGIITLTNGIAWYRLNAEAGRRYIIRATPAGADAMIPRIISEDFTVVAATGESNALVWTCASNGMYFLALHTIAPQQYSLRVTRAIGANTFDFDADGASDLALYNRNYGYWFVRSLQGDILIWARQWGGPGLQPVCADYDADGKTDLAVYGDKDTFWYAQNADAGLIFWRLPWGGEGFAPVRGDFDGDGADDIAVYHEQTGLWFIRSLGGTVIAWNQPWGGPGFDPVPGDFDGDGASDMAVYAESVGMWYVFSLTKQQVLAWNIWWGGPGFDPVQGDYDGDQKSDFTVYDPAAGRWYILSADNSLLAWGLHWGGPWFEPAGAQGQP